MTDIRTTVNLPGGVLDICARPSYAGWAGEGDYSLTIFNKGGTICALSQLDTMEFNNRADLVVYLTGIKFELEAAIKQIYEQASVK